MIYVISDIHGNMPRFRSILHQIELQPEDHLYVLGDVVDRFPDGIAILQELMEMPNCTVLLGNHEYMMLNAIKDKWMRNLWYSNGGRVTDDYFWNLTEEEQNKVIDFIKSMPINMKVTVNVGGQNVKFLLVHGAPEEMYYKSDASVKYDSATEFSVWFRLDYQAEWVRSQVAQDEVIIFGHTPTCHYQEKTPISIWYGNKCIGVDCAAGTYQGRLACLRLDDMKEFYSEV